MSVLAPPARRFLTVRTVAALMLREMATTYGRHPGGYVWAVVEPVAAIALLTVIFSMAFRAPALGSSFPLFFATGYLPLMLFLDASNKVGVAVRFSRPLLTYPRVTLLDAVLARFLLAVLTQATVFCVVIAGILWLFDTNVILDIPAILLGLAMAAALALGIGTLNCYLMAAFPIWERAWQIFTRPLFLVSGVFFVFEDLSAGWGRDLLWFNPTIHFIGETRKGFYATYDAPYVSVLYVSGIAGASLLLGLLLIRRHSRNLLGK